MSMGSMLFAQFLGGMAKRSMQRKDEAREALREQEKFEREQNFINATWENRQRFLDNMAEQKKKLEEEKETEKWIKQITPLVEDDPQFAAKIYQNYGAEGIQDWLKKARELKSTGVNIVTTVEGQKIASPLINMPNVAQINYTYQGIISNKTSSSEEKDKAEKNLIEITRIQNIGKETEGMSISQANGLHTLIKKSIDNRLIADAGEKNLKYTYSDTGPVPDLDKGYYKWYRETIPALVFDQLKTYGVERQYWNNFLDVYLGATPIVGSGTDNNPNRPEQFTVIR